MVLLGGMFHLHSHLIFHLLPFHFLSFLPIHPHKSETLATFLHLPLSSRPNHLPPWTSTQTFTFSSSPCVAKAPHLLLQRKCACRFNIWPHVLVLVLCRFQTIFIFCLVNFLIKTHQTRVFVFSSILPHFSLKSLFESLYVKTQGLMYVQLYEFICCDLLMYDSCGMIVFLSSMIQS